MCLWIVSCLFLCVFVYLYVSMFVCMCSMCRCQLPVTGLSWLQVGSKPGLKTVQELDCNYFLGQVVPFGYGPGEE